MFEVTFMSLITWNKVTRQTLLLAYKENVTLIRP